VTRTLRIGTRGSKLALAQTGTVADALRAAGERVELVVISTAGDRSDRPVSEIGVGAFTSALREALVSGEIDVAVHSYKDLPTAPDPRLVLAAVPAREDPRDALVARDGLTLGELPPGSTVGTGSPRRAAQLEALGLGLRVLPIRGNVDTRLAKVTSGELDAVVLARAGLARLGLLDAVTEVLDPLQMLPAPAQGALAVECRAGGANGRLAGGTNGRLAGGTNGRLAGGTNGRLAGGTHDRLAGGTHDRLAGVDAEHLLRSTMDDQASRATTAAERALLAALEAGCSAPVGALADVVEDLDEGGAVIHVLSLRAVTTVGISDTGELLRASAIGPMLKAEQLGRDLAAELLDLGAASLVDRERGGLGTT
jgi:hydroxymethylbilane synthase